MWDKRFHKEKPNFSLLNEMFSSKTGEEEGDNRGEETGGENRGGENNRGENRGEETGGRR